MYQIKEDNEYTIYQHINKINQKRYIGQTCQVPSHRWGKDGHGYKGQMFYKAIQKYGWDNFEHEILASHLSKEEADELEKYYIHKYNTTNPNNGYNIETGGNTTIFKSGKEHPNAKSVVCLETKQIFDTVKEASFWAGLSKNDGHIHSACIGERLTAGKHPQTQQPLHWLYLEDYNDENIKKQLQKTAKPDPKIKKIKCKNTQQIFNTMEEAMQWAGLKSKSGICLVCQGKRNFAGKHPQTQEKLSWEYA